ncbi:MAG TPA: murein biosynthesis integral membrane protein MurJ [Candidatus Dormibacteraeota bacterium]|nr:murein biosynthesis integral membrane protein MurJ [Candidatus Dormibacteraeota bacterium]
MTTKGQLLKSASVVALVTVISRICGYLRDQRIALLLGTSPTADSFILAFRIPGLIRRMAGEGSLGASFIPVFTGYLHNESRPQAWAFAQKVFWDVALTLAALALLGTLFSRQVIGLLTIFGAHHGQWQLAVFLNRIIFPAILFIGLAAVAASILNSFHVFALPAATPIFFNLALIACSFAIVRRPILRWAPVAYRSPAVALAVGILIGGVIQLGMQIPALVRRGMNLRPRFSISDPGVRKVGRLAAPAFFGMGVYQINMFVDTIFAASSRMPQGSIMSLYVADRVMQLVLGSYAIAMSTALLPTMSHQWAAGQWSEMRRTFGFSLRVVSFITVPAAVGLILLRQPIIQVLFQHGRFTAASTALTTHALFYYSLGLPAFAGVKLIAPLYYSTQDTATPARTGAYALGLNVALNTFFLLFFFRTLSNGGPALASSIAAYFNFGALFFLFRKRYGQLGARALVQSFCKIAACAAGMGFAAYGALRISHFAQARHLLLQVGLLAGIICAAVAAYFALAWLLRCEELQEVFVLLRWKEPATASAVESGV